MPFLPKFPAVCAAAFLAVACFADKYVPAAQHVDKRMDIEINNLLDNPYLKEGGKNVPPAQWDMAQPPEGGFSCAAGLKYRAFKLTAVPGQAVVIGQVGLYLVPGEKYRVSGYIRGENFEGTGEVGVIGKAFRNVKGFRFNTRKVKDQWYYFEVDFVHELRDICRFVMYVQKGSSGSVVIERPTLEPLTEKGLKGSKRLLANDDFEARYAKAKAEGFRSGPPSDDYELVWHDEFDGDKLDTSKWVNYVLDYRKKRNQMIDTPHYARLNGKGQLELVNEFRDGIFYTPFPHTRTTFMPTFGYFECRFKLHKEDMLNATFFLLPPDRKRQVDVGPEKNGYEIDIMECILPSMDQISQTTHYKAFDGKKYTILSGGTIARRMPGLSQGWHTVGFEWTPDNYRFFIDGVESYALNKAYHPIAHAPLYMILSFEVHRTFAAKIAKEGKPWKSSVYSIDYVRVYQKKKSR
ncbi:MAG: glycoside hydrolase family 16 protein [Lentisphaeria bacterium]|nr:glycoside hydrolase family 16 protein [Lentisphaeria bacterium]